MITAVLIKIVSSFLLGVLGFFPDDAGLPSGVTTAIGQVGAYLHLFDYFFPVYFTLQAVVTVLIFEGLVWTGKLIRWVTGVIAAIIP